MSNVYLVPRDEALAFLDNDDFRLKSGIIGRDLEEVFANYHFLGSLAEGRLIACTGIKQIGDQCIESHTYVLPECRRLAVKCLSEQIIAAKQLGAKKVVTVATPLVENFLIKRLGFKKAEGFLFKEI